MTFLQILRALFQGKELVVLDRPALCQELANEINAGSLKTLRERMGVPEVTSLETMATHLRALDWPDCSRERYGVWSAYSYAAAALNCASGPHEGEWKLALAGSARKEVANCPELSQALRKEFACQMAGGVVESI